MTQAPRCRDQARPEAIAKPPPSAKKIAAGAKLFGEIQDEDVAIATTPKDEVWRRTRSRSTATARSPKPKIKTPVLIVYGLIGRYTMADLQEDRSLVRNLLELGVDLYVVDWGNPTRADRWLTIDDYVDDYLAGAVDAIRAAHGIDKVNLLGICEGGVFTTCYAALHPDTVKNLVLTITPIDFHGDKAQERLGHGFINLWTRSLTPGGHRPPDRGARQAAGRVHGLGVLDDDADADADEVQPRHARGHGRQEEVLELPAHGEVDRRPAAPSRRGGEAMAQGPLPGQQAREAASSSSAGARSISEHHRRRCSTSSPRTTTSSRPRPRRALRGSRHRRTTPSSRCPAAMSASSSAASRRASSARASRSWLAERP